MGAVLCGSKAFIDTAWYYKFQQGGAMHQVGILAAGCLYALENHRERLAEDHEHAQLLAQLLKNHPHVLINPKDIETNIVIFRLHNTKLTAYQLAHALLGRGIRLLALDDNKLRAIVHQGISQHDIHTVSQAIQYALNGSSLPA